MWNVYLQPRSRVATTNVTVGGPYRDIEMEALLRWVRLALVRAQRRTLGRSLSLLTASVI